MRMFLSSLAIYLDDTMGTEATQNMQSAEGNYAADKTVSSNRLGVFSTGDSSAQESGVGAAEVMTLSGVVSKKITSTT